MQIITFHCHDVICVICMLKCGKKGHGDTGVNREAINILKGKEKLQHNNVFN